MSHSDSHFSSHFFEPMKIHTIEKGTMEIDKIDYVKRTVKTEVCVVCLRGRARKRKRARG